MTGDSALSDVLAALVFGGAIGLLMSKKYDSVNRRWVEEGYDWVPRFEPFEVVGWRNEQGDARVIYEPDSNAEPDGGLVIKSDYGYDTDEIR